MFFVYRTFNCLILKKFITKIIACLKIDFLVTTIGSKHYEIPNFIQISNRVIHKKVGF